MLSPVKPFSALPTRLCVWIVPYVIQAFQSSSAEKLDHILAACVLKKMPTGGFQGLQNDQTLTGGKWFSGSGLLLISDLNSIQQKPELISS